MARVSLNKVQIAVSQVANPLKSRNQNLGNFAYNELRRRYGGLLILREQESQRHSRRSHTYTHTADFFQLRASAFSNQLQLLFSRQMLGARDSIEKVKRAKNTGGTSSIE